jgi:hypothetical protein
LLCKKYRKGAKKASELKNATQYCDLITPKEFKYQTLSYTQNSISSLMKTKEYKKMLKTKSRSLFKWNWQVKKDRSQSELEEEHEYLKNVERISNEELILEEKEEPKV